MIAGGACNLSVMQYVHTQLPFSCICLSSCIVTDHPGPQGAVPNAMPAPAHTATQKVDLNNERVVVPTGGNARGISNLKGEPPPPPPPRASKAVCDCWPPAHPGCHMSYPWLFFRTVRDWVGPERQEGTGFSFEN